MDFVEDEFILLRSSLDYNFFCENILGLEVRPYHKIWTSMITNHKRVAIKAFRGSGKTTWLCVAFFLWLVFKSKNKEFAIIAQKLDQSKKILKEIRSLILESKFLKSLAPDPAARLKSWTATSVDLSNGCKIFCVAYSEKVRGVHVDGVFCDEVSLYEDKEIFFGAVTNIVNAKDGFIIAAGTPMSMIDLLSDLERNREYVFGIFPVLDSDGSVWPSRYSAEKLKSIENDIGPLQFAREFLCKPMSLADSPFPPQFIHRASDESDIFELIPDDGPYFMGVDLAMSSGERADFSVFTILKEVKVNERKKLKIAYIVRMKGARFEDQIQKLVELADKYTPERIVVDKSNIGQVFFQDLESRYLNRVVGFNFTNRSKRDLITNLRTCMAKNELIIPRGEDAYTRGLTESLIGEMGAFIMKRTKMDQITYEALTGHDDMVISLALARQAQEGLQEFVCAWHVSEIPMVNRKVYKNEILCVDDD